MVTTYIIIFITVVISILALSNEEIFSRLKFNAYDVKHSNQWYRFFTYGFIHAGYVHLIINMIVLYSFANIVETRFQSYFPGKGSFYYLLLYAGGLLLSIIPAFGKHKNDVFYNAVGASGAVSSVLFSSILLYPTGKIFFFFIPIPIPAPVFGILYLAYEYYMAKHGRDNIGHDAHLWGAIFGIVYTLALKPGIIFLFLEQIGLK
ncbi:MAG: rhomboid family intramembrane serine protease [Bacteroidales bacterium]|jgi:membrane associated rhomboid family serine protease|nr:rhomboid family intramembrane serine protease [Bacteroidales bacterium]